MSIELKVPQVGESITEVQIGDWLVPEGQSVAKEDAVVVIETDKVTVELPAPAAGTVSRVLKQKGEKARVGEVIGYLENGQGPAKEKKEAPVEAKKGAPAKKPEPTSAPRVMPSARRALHEAGLTAADVKPSGPGGRIVKEDVARPPAGNRQEEVVPMTPLRKRIAERLVQAKATAALLTTFNEIDMSAVSALRKEHQEAFQQRYGIKLGFMSFFVKPQVNAEVRGENIVYRNYFDIGVAVGGGKGLVVPIIRNAERLSFAEVEVAIADLAKRAQENKLAIEELAGGTFTISNGGIYGSLLSTPIVNPPQSGILGLHAIQDRPVARDGQVVIRPMMYVAVTYDHRVVDGREAVTFLKRIKECIEAPSRMLLET
jgi:2-oxoglutarate dehydrogenase E2 component (dihydrolipoamide succinyltransferase)